MRFKIITIFILILISSVRLFGIIPPTLEELESYRKDGSLPGRIQRVKELGCHRFDPALVKRKAMRMKALREGVKIDEKLLPYPVGLPSKGAPSIFTLLIEFPDYLHSQEVSVFQNKIFGDGESAEYPYESLTEYYKRASYNQLDIRGNVLGWYTAKFYRSYYGAEDHSGVIELIKEALQAIDLAGHDFSQYDNNSDGRIDYFSVIWTGPDNGWGNLWWGWCDIRGQMFSKDSFKVDGKNLGVFSWQWEKNETREEYSFVPVTLIHETGHGLGLPDYYDYYEESGPAGGVGGLDMMHGNYADHNGFSKWILEWLSPAVIGQPDGVHSISLKACHSQGDCVVIMPDMNISNPFREYFLIQNRSSGGNDSYGAEINGMLIWHVDATLNAGGDNFLYDNSYTSHKLLKLMEADGNNRIEEGDGKAEISDFYSEGNSFTPLSNPNSNNYAGNVTNVSVTNISTGGQTMSADFTLGDEQSQTPTPTPTSTPSGDTSLQVGSGSAIPEQNVTIPIIIDKSSGCTAFGMDLMYDTNRLSYDSVTKGSATSDWAFIDASGISGGVRIGGLAGSGTAVNGDSKEIAQITFTVQAQACPGGDITLSPQNLKDCLAGITVTNGSVTPICGSTPTPTPTPTPTAPPGDVDLDILMDYILGRLGLSSTQKDQADFNNDDDIDSADVIKYIIENPTPTPTPAPVTLRIGSGQGAPGENVTISVTVDGVNSCTAFGMDLIYDTTKLTYVSTQKGSASSDWAFIDSSVISGGLRTGGLAGTGTGISGTGQEIVKIIFKIEDAACPGAESITLTGSNLKDCLSGAAVLNGVVTPECN